MQHSTNHNLKLMEATDNVRRQDFVDNFNAQAPKHLVTYTDFVGEFVSWTSNRSSGAVGLPSFLIYSYYFC